MKRFSSERGAALVEMAIVAPILLLVFAGIADSGLLFRNFEVTVNAAREGARLAALPGNEENDYAIVRARVTGYMRSARVAVSGDPTPPTIEITQVSIPIDPASGVMANGVRVTVTHDYDCLFLGPVAGLLSGTFTNTITYRSSALMRIQVPAVGL